MKEVGVSLWWDMLFGIHCLWVCSVKISWRMGGVLEEQDGDVVGVSWPGPVSSQLSRLNAHFRL